MERVPIQLFAALVCFGCDRGEPTLPHTGDFAITATAVVEGQLVDQLGLSIADASVILLVLPPNPPTPNTAPHTAPQVDVDRFGRFRLNTRRIAMTLVGRNPDTLSAHIITRVPRNSTNAQSDTVLLHFSPVDVSPTPTAVQLRWRGTLP